MRKIMHWVMIVAIISSTCVLTSCSNNDREADIVKIQGGKWDPTSAESAIGKLAAQAKEESNKGRYLLQSSFEHE